MSILDGYDSEPDDASVQVGIIVADVAPEAVQWLWYGRIPAGKVSVIDGDPGLGKSTLTLDLAARVSCGLPMPDDRVRIGPAGVVLLSAEDDIADTIRPRLDAAGADLERIVALSEIDDGDGRRPPVLPDDLSWVRAAISRVDARLVIVDPLMAFLSGAIDSHKDQEVRRGLHLLALLAAETGAAVLLVRHLNKAVGGNPLYRGGGSIGIVGAARSGLVVGRDPADPTRRVLASTKCNLAPEPPSLAFHIETVAEASVIRWDGVSDSSAADVLSLGNEEERTARDEAAAFLREILADGEMPARDVKRLAREADIAERTLARAKRELKVESRQLGHHSGWVWSLPTLPSSQDQNPGNLATWHTDQPTHPQNATVPQCQENGPRSAGTLTSETIPFDDDEEGS
ncbi:MAG: AAA family ATPase [Coriobacteriia bacterium]|nr:AAA family ATPase [Coriobacteriia bacterium]